MMMKGIHSQLTKDFNTPRYVFFQFRMWMLWGVKISVVDDVFWDQALKRMDKFDNYMWERYLLKKYLFGDISILKLKDPV